MPTFIVNLRMDHRPIIVTANTISDAAKLARKSVEGSVYARRVNRYIRDCIRVTDSYRVASTGSGKGRGKGRIYVSLTPQQVADDDWMRYLSHAARLPVVPGVDYSPDSDDHDDDDDRQTLTKA
jgi:hypothetical protein